MEYLTLGQVIDNLRKGQVAIKIDGNYGICDYDDTKKCVEGILYVNDDDNFLMADDGQRVSGICLFDNDKRDQYIIVTRKQYETMKENI